MTIKTDRFNRKLLHVDYIQQMVNYYCLKHPEADRKAVIKIIADSTMAKLQEIKPTVTIDGEQIDLLKADSIIVKQGMIVTGRGNLYNNHHKSHNFAGEMIQYLLNERSARKKAMFAAMKEGNTALQEMHDNAQKTLKVLNNSYFGASIEKSSFSYNPYTGDSIMSSGRDVITISVNIFEKWLANNIYFRDVTDCITYARDVIDDYNDGFNPFNIKFKQFKSVASVADYLLSKTDDYTAKDKEDLIEYLSTCPSKEAINLIYYKNNLLEFFRDSNIISEYMMDVLGREDFLDPNKVPEDITDKMKVLWDVIHEYTFHNHQDYYRYKNMERKRRAVLTIDTDSNFLYLDPALKTLASLVPEKVNPEDPTSVVANINVIMYLATNIINETYIRYGMEVGIPEEFTTRINMKNEFLLETLMTTTNKKHYASIVLMQEGVIYKNPKIDLKGLSIKKTNTNPVVRQTFTDILEEEILKPKKVNVSQIIKKYRNLEEDIKSSLLNGETTFALPTSVNNPKGYENPLQIKGLRGALFWNRLFPDKEITFPAKLNCVNLNLNLKTLEESSIAEDKKEMLRDILHNANFALKQEITVISFPRYIKELPDYLLPFIEVHSTIGTNLSPGNIILESAGGTILTSQGDIDISTNVIRI